MGMYDSIISKDGDDYQIKVFNWPMWTSGGLMFSGGSCGYYGIGDEVPYRTRYYNYGEDFNIWNDEVLIKIRDKKVNDILFFNQVSDEDFEGVNTVEYWGEEINVHSREDLQAYRGAMYEWENEVVPEMRKITQGDHEKMRDAEGEERVKILAEWKQHIDLLDEYSTRERERLFGRFQVEDKYADIKHYGALLDIYENYENLPVSFLKHKEQFEKEHPNIRKEYEEYDTGRICSEDE